MLVPEFVCEVACASGFGWSMDGDAPWDMRSIVRKARPNSIALEKGEFRNTLTRYQFSVCRNYLEISSAIALTSTRQA